MDFRIASSRLPPLTVLVWHAENRVRRGRRGGFVPARFRATAAGSEEGRRQRSRRGRPRGGWRARGRREPIGAQLAVAGRGLEAGGEEESPAQGRGAGRPAAAGA
ncbi:hypothetical protein ZWY2020_016681 [Hordeum vulgare]|nr:hypothetical protein ZWY2020_016681 [Hordeum vulgare]